MIIYEQPLNEICRCLLRLEYLQSLYEQTLESENSGSYHNALVVICHILDLLDRPDLRSKLAKTTQDFIRNLGQLEGESEFFVQEDAEKWRQKLTNISHVLIENTGKLGGQGLREDLFLTNIRQHLLSNPTGISDFDMPLYHHRLKTNDSELQACIKSWYTELGDVLQITNTLLTLLRDSASFTGEEAEKGFYRRHVNYLPRCQLARIELSKDQTVFPKVSAAHRGFCIHFFEASFSTRPVQSVKNIVFKLALCAI